MALGLFSGTASAQSINVSIQCEPQSGYYLCNADPLDTSHNYTWSTTGGLILTMASGPVVSAQCWANQGGALMLNVSDGNGGSGYACMNLSCGNIDPADTCAAQAGSGGSGGGGNPGPGGPGDGDDDNPEP
ncbi:hypothetical protein DZC52_12320 [Wenzhouxiangella sediminis]|uniref:Uncharacterized protein n=2 Tax=Wenzhouxiangella sediminis TaxID=1792836 RepID=A0A3E1K6M5_9GAMM|nr:hypothetical protein DZC52_12320 [Wenzhouxiangella sediminis]